MPFRSRFALLGPQPTATNLQPITDTVISTQSGHNLFWYQKETSFFRVFLPHLRAIEDYSDVGIPLVMYGTVRQTSQTKAFHDILGVVCLLFVCCLFLLVGATINKYLSEDTIYQGDPKHLIRFRQRVDILSKNNFSYDVRSKLYRGVGAFHVCMSTRGRFVSFRDAP